MTKAQVLAFYSIEPQPDMSPCVARLACWFGENESLLRLHASAGGLAALNDFQVLLNDAVDCPLLL